METIPVLWPDEFGGEIVNINASDFDPKIHKRPGETPARSESSDSRTKAELVEDAEAKGLDVKTSMTKADLTDMLDLASKTKDELVKLAESKGIDTKGMTKAEIVDALKAQGEN